MNMKRSIAIILSLFLSESMAFSLKTEQWQTQNGAKIVFYQANEVPMLDVFVAFNAGSAYDGKNYGISALTTRLMNEGAGNLNATQVAEKLADTGAQFNAETSRNMALLHLRTLSHEEALKSSTDLFTMIINKPLFRQDAFYREKSQLLSTIAQAAESPDEVANIAFFNKLYENHPYAHPINGTQASVKAIQPWQIRPFYKQYFVGANTIIVMVGDIDSAQAHALADKMMAQLPQGEPAAAIPEATPLTQAIQENISFPSSQSVLRLGQLGTTHSSPIYFPLMVGNYILGGGTMVSRLSKEIREQRGLSYSVSSDFMPLPGNGPFIINLSTKNDQRNEALEVTKKTLRRFLTEGPTEQELAEAKQYLTGSFSLSLASNSNIATTLLRLRFYNLPDNYLDTYVAHIESVTTEDIKNAFNSLIKPDALLQITVGKA